MTGTQKVLVGVGIGFDVLAVVLGGLMALLFGFSLSSPEMIAQVAQKGNYSEELVRAALNYSLTLFIILAVVEAVVLIVAIIALSKFKGKAYNITFLALGIAGLNLFFLISSIIGLVKGNPVE